MSHDGAGVARRLLEDAVRCGKDDVPSVLISSWVGLFRATKAVRSSQGQSVPII